MHTLDAQDDVSRLCQSAQLDPLAYKRFELPAMTIPATAGNAELSLPEPSAAGGRQQQAELATDAPSPDPDEHTVAPVQTGETALALASESPGAHEPSHEDCNGHRPAAIAPTYVRHVRLSWPERPTENGLSALASVHDRVSSGLSVLPLASAVGGAGTTTILAGLGRALSILGERVLLVDASAPSTLDYFYPSRGGESGLLHSTQPYSPFEGQMHVLRTDNEGPGAAQSCATRMHRAVAELRGQLDRIVVAGQDALTPVIAQQARAGGVCLMLVTPELRSLLALPAILRTFRPTNSAAGAGIKPVFILNRFQQADPTHSEIRKHMAAELGPQLLPFCIPESATVPQSLAERVNPLDLSPQSPFAEACFNLAELYRARVSAYQSISSQPEENQLVSE